jgi:hypothetical protein
MKFLINRVFGTVGGINTCKKRGSSLKCTIGSKNITRSQAASLGRFKLLTAAKDQLEVYILGATV